MGYGGRGASQGVAKWVWFYPAAESTLRQCGIKKNDNIIIYTDTNRNKDIFDTFFAAATNLGAEVIGIIANPGYGGHSEATREPKRMVIQQMKACDLVIDLPSSHWAYTDAYNEVLDAGTRILLSCADEDLCIRLIPIEEVIQRTVRGAELLTRASTLKLTSQSGTNLTLSVEGRVCNPQVGCLGDSRQWDHYPSGLTEIAPIEDSANGTLVLSPGDPIVELNRLLTESIVLTIDGGQITKIEGEGEARILEIWFDQWNDPNMKTLAHMGFGTDHRANLFTGEAMDWESLLGGINVAFGVNTARFLGGKNSARAHIDIIVRNTTMQADETVLVREGKLVY